MKVYESLKESPVATAVALGSFDGIHLGHQKVIAQTMDLPGLSPTVLTFAENPLCDLGGHAGGELITRQQKILILESLGVEQLYILEFRDIMHFSPEEFVDEILQKVCHAKKVCCGFNYTFGAGGRGTEKTLETLCEKRGIETAVVPAVLEGGEPISSTRIRGLVARGNMGEAARLLGRPYGYFGTVCHGRRLGHSLGTPTLNQRVPQSFVLPRFGVYVSRVLFDGKHYCGVTNVGIKPTVGSKEVLAETWMPFYEGPDLYGKEIQTELLHFQRPEQKFPSIEALKEQIRKDGKAALEFYARNRNFS